MRRQSDHEGGFTLVEMLVVLGIIVVLAGVLLPVLTGARRASANTKCLNNLRQIGLAMLQYMTDNEQTIPFALSSNCWDDPFSKRGAAERIGGSPYMPVAYYLDGYLRNDLRVWQCPGSRMVRQEAPKTMRAPVTVMSHLPHVKDNVDMWLAGGQWRPSYMFLSTHGWRVWYYYKERPVWDKYGMSEWKVRNVSGLRLSEIKTVTGQPSSQIVLFYDYATAFHSKATDDVYDLAQSGGNVTGFGSGSVARRKFQSNFLYLDAHVDSQSFEWQGGLLNRIHRPIPQRWDLEPEEGDYTKAYAASYKIEYQD